MLDRFHLSILSAVDSQGTLTKAAESLHLSQSALSHSIKKLEAHVGSKVWEKDGRHLRFTQAGYRLLALAKRVLPQFEHTELQLQHIKDGQMGALRIGMECHPCYQWLLKVVAPFLQHWPDVDVDVKQAFQFGGMQALFDHEIDILVTPDPLFKPEIRFTPVFDYEHKLVLAKSHPLACKAYIEPQDLANETLLSYPVEPQRLDIYSRFLQPAACDVKRHRIIETTEIMLQMVVARRGVCALPGWLVDEYTDTLDITSVKIGKSGLDKSIYLGTRKADEATPYLESFMEYAKQQH